MMTLYPNAKINIGLFVTSKRSDGYHNLESVFLPVSLCDILEIEEINGNVGDCYFEQNGIIIDCPMEENIVVKAYQLLSFHYKLPSVSISLQKRMPTGAGLGGGSSDAAFCLKALNEYFHLKITENQLMRFAASLGSDCMFFIKNTPAFVSSRGDNIKPIDFQLLGYKICILKPPFGVSTKEAYSKIVPKSASFNLNNLSKLTMSKWREIIFNDFEERVFVKYPEINELKRYLYSIGAIYASMSGSGSAVYGIFEKYPDVQENNLPPDTFYSICEFI
ncbi:MAG: 4-(cytidine 5'-diphospho)-2-C-methyl-D-erythritol kinase [Culturomica sp.]|jgi:4-diphosphocytidyl-2-C-methyl-D-erythritol kinase|nr:4-(cytidine 5'-diphospho)-2-C-methyl-D-erythritol kinase [Culturomica sp.]